MDYTEKQVKKMLIRAMRIKQGHEEMPERGLFPPYEKVADYVISDAKETRTQ